MAAVLSAYLIANGAADAPAIGSQTKPDKDADAGGRTQRQAQAARFEQVDRAGPSAGHTASPEPERARGGGPPSGCGAQLLRRGQHARRTGTQGPQRQTTGAARRKRLQKSAEPAGREVSERGPDGRKLEKRRLGKRSDTVLRTTGRTEKGKRCRQGDTAKTDVRPIPARTNPRRRRRRRQARGEAAKGEAAQTTREPRAARRKADLRPRDRILPGKPRPKSRPDRLRCCRRFACRACVPDCCVAVRSGSCNDAAIGGRFVAPATVAVPPAPPAAQSKAGELRPLLQALRPHRRDRRPSGSPAPPVHNRVCKADFSIPR